MHNCTLCCMYGLGSCIQLMRTSKKRKRKTPLCVKIDVVVSPIKQMQIYFILYKQYLMKALKASKKKEKTAWTQ